MSEDKVKSRRRLYLVRHGHVDYFDKVDKPIDPRWVELSSIGQKQVSSLKDVLCDVKFDYMLCSDYPRAKQTLNIITAGYSESKSVIECSDLREIKAGRLREIPVDIREREVATAYHQVYSKKGRFLRGESWTDFFARVVHTFENELLCKDWDQALIVSHDAVNRVLISFLVNGDMSLVPKIEQDPACLNIIDLEISNKEVNEALLRLVNFTAYNPSKYEINDTVMEDISRRVLGNKI